MVTQAPASGHSKGPRSSEPTQTKSSMGTGQSSALGLLGLRFLLCSLGKVWGGHWT